VKHLINTLNASITLGSPIQIAKGWCVEKTAEDVEDVIRGDRRRDIDTEFDSARQINNYTTLADDTPEALPNSGTHPREEAPIIVESSSEDSE
jgi:hypothetical protein